VGKKPRRGNGRATKDVDRTKKEVLLVDDRQKARTPGK